MPEDVLLYCTLIKNPPTGKKKKQEWKSVSGLKPYAFQSLGPKTETNRSAVFFLVEGQELDSPRTRCWVLSFMKVGWKSQVPLTLCIKLHLQGGDGCTQHHYHHFSYMPTISAASPPWHCGSWPEPPWMAWFLIWTMMNTWRYRKTPIRRH
jgi:hypothetical protein